MTTFSEFISKNPYYDYHYITDNGKLVVQYDGCGCGCEDYVYTQSFDVVDGIVTINDKQYIADENI